MSSYSVLTATIGCYYFQNAAQTTAFGLRV